MDLRLLRSFLAAATEQNISRAAQQLHMTQPALSRQIKALEESLDALLLDRGAHSFVLTPAGQILLKEGPALLAHAGQVTLQVQHKAVQQVLRVGYSPSLSSGILAKAMEWFSHRHPEVKLELHDVSHQTMVTELMAKNLDIILSVMSDKAVEEVQWHPISEEPWQVAMASSHALSKLKAIDAQQLLEQKLCIYDPAEYPGYWSRLHSWIKTSKLKLRVVAEYDGITSLFSGVEAAIGIALLPTRSGQIKPQGVILRPLKNAPPSVLIAAGVREGEARSVAMITFMDALAAAGSAKPLAIAGKVHSA